MNNRNRTNGRVAFLPLYQIEWPSSRYRIFQFLESLEQHGFQCQVLAAPQLNFWKRLWYVPRLLPLVVASDALFIQKRMLPLWLLRLVKRLNSRIVFDIDDAVYLRPANRVKINAMLSAAAVVIAGNQELADYARQWNKNVVVIPSVVDTNLYYPVEGQRHPGDHRIIIGWIGGDPNRGDFTGMKPVLDWLAATYGDRLALRIIGRRPLAIETELTVEFVPWTLDGSRAALQQFDIGIMPLEDTEWNRGKCGFKLIQYMAVGATAVASPVGVNAEIVQSGPTGFLAHNQTEWQTSLKQLIENEELRDEIGRRARARIEQFYSVNAVLPQLIEIIERAIEGH
ncbi:MAG: glycosyltransferase family 4 protein [Chloroflexi bacterium]|nr:glycosyltransferase family 4 protein [Chloroflexota bacterium]